MNKTKLTKGALARKLIIEEALKAFARQGYAGTSLQYIADKAGIAQTAALYYFKNKEGLFEAVLHFILQENAETVRQSESPNDDAWTKLQKYCEMNLKWAKKNSGQAQNILLLYYMSCYDVEFAKLHRQIKMGAQLKIYELVLSGVREGLFHLQEPAESVAASIHEMIIGGIINHITDLKLRENASTPRRDIDDWRPTLALLVGFKK